MPDTYADNRDKRRQKEKLVDQLLENPVYLPNAELRLRLRARLMRLLSLEDMQNLLILHNCRREPCHVIALVEGGVVQGAKGRGSVIFEVLDLDNAEDTTDPKDALYFEQLRDEYEKLPNTIY